MNIITLMLIIRDVLRAGGYNMLIILLICKHKMIELHNIVDRNYFCN